MARPCGNGGTSMCGTSRAQRTERSGLARGLPTELVEAEVPVVPVETDCSTVLENEPEESCLSSKVSPLRELDDMTSFFNAISKISAGSVGVETWRRKLVFFSANFRPTASELVESIFGLLLTIGFCAPPCHCAAFPS